MGKPYDAVISFAGIFSKNILTYLQNNLCKGYQFKQQ